MNQKERAIEYLKKGLQENIWSPGDRLPGLKKLAVDAKVSHPVMAKALHYLSDKGLLEISPRSGISVVNTNGTDRQPSIEHRERWKKLRTDIANDLFSRALDISQPLPSMQELRHRYGVNFPILKKALSSLENDGLLTSYKKTYKPNLFSSLKYKATLLVLCNIFPDNLNRKGINLNEQGFDLSHRVWILMQKLEQLSSTQNFSIELWGYFFENNSTTYLKPDHSICHSIENIKNYYGVCLIKTAPHTNDFSNMLSLLAKNGLPISIFDVTGELEWTVPPVKRGSIRVFSVGATDLAGKKIGRYLLELGHREVAFISAWDKDGWTKNRYTGLCNAFAMVSGSQIHLYADKRYPEGAITLDDKILEEKIYSMPSLQNMLLSNSPFSHEQVETIVYEVSPTFIATMYRQRLEIFLQPIFEEALLNPEITAWVCADDLMAISALRFLSKKGVEVPEKISVVGFEDILEAISANLTTYNFDIRGVAQTMVAFISNPSLFPVKEGLFLEKNGFVVPRQSSGIVKGDG